MESKITAAIITIGAELISGSVQDLNSNIIAQQLEKKGIVLKEIRILPDEKKLIVDAIKELKSLYTYVITTGGIGFTHDDITISAVAEAFDVKIVRDETLESRIITKHEYKKNSSLLRLADIPENCTLIENGVSIAPGVQMGNVFCLAGSTKMMRTMLQAVLPRLANGNKIYTESYETLLPESSISDDLGRLNIKYPEVDIGSYPIYAENSKTVVVFKSIFENSLKNALDEFIKTLNV